MKRFLQKLNFYWALGLLMLVLTFVLGVPFINSDGYCYYHVASSLREYGTFTSTVRPEYYDYRGHVIAYYNGKYGDVCAAGTSIAELPGLVIAKAFRTPQQTIYSDYFLAYNGHTLADGLAVLFTAVIFGYLSLCMLYSYFKRMKLPGKWPAFLTVAITVSAYLQWYVFIQAGYTHVYEFFAVTALLLLGAKYQQDRSAKYIVLSGLAAGFGFLVRPTFAIVILAAFAWLFYLSKHKLKTILYFALAALPFLLLYFAYNYQSYGTLIASGYDTIRGENFIFDWQHFNFLNVLFSPQRGWFVYSPLFLFGCGGLIWQIWKEKNGERLLAELLLGVILLTALVYGFWPAWWGGGSNGARFLIVLAPLTAPGLVYLWKQTRDMSRNWRRTIVAGMWLSIIFSAVVGFCYLFTPVDGLRPMTDNVGNMQSGDRYTPADLIDHQLQLLTSATSVKDYISSVFRGFTGGNTNLILSMGIEDAVLRIDERTPGQVSFLIVPPENMSQPLADNVIFYLEDVTTKTVYLGQLLKPQPEGKYTFAITGDEFTSSSPQLSFTLLQPADFPYLDLKSFTGLCLDNYPVKLFFGRAFNIKFAGPPQNRPPVGQLEYHFGDP